VTPKLRKPGGCDMVVLRVTAEGTKHGAPKQVGWELIDRYDEERGISAMMRSTGFSLSITAQMQVRGETGPPGVCLPDECIPAARYMEELASRGLEIRPVDFGAIERRTGEERRAEASAVG
jgi:lysine 6-dehydrogenase